MARPFSSTTVGFLAIWIAPASACTLGTANGCETNVVAHLTSQILGEFSRAGVKFSSVGYSAAAQRARGLAVNDASGFQVCLNQEVNKFLTAIQQACGAELAAVATHLGDASEKRESNSASIWTWSCNKVAAQSIVAYGECVCPQMVTYVNGLQRCVDAGSDRQSPNLDANEMSQAAVSGMVDLLCPGLEFTCNGANSIAHFKFSKIVIKFSINDVGAELQIEKVVSTVSGIDRSYITVALSKRGGRRLSSSDALVTISDLPPKTAQGAKAKLQDDFAPALQAEMSGAVISNMKITEEEQIEPLSKFGISPKQDISRAHFPARVSIVTVLPLLLAYHQ